jgi:hypothetical protein
MERGNCKSLESVAIAITVSFFCWPSIAHTTGCLAELLHLGMAQKIQARFLSLDI